MVINNPQPSRLKHPKGARGSSPSASPFDISTGALSLTRLSKSPPAGSSPAGLCRLKDLLDTAADL